MSVQKHLDIIRPQQFRQGKKPIVRKAKVTIVVISLALIIILSAAFFYAFLNRSGAYIESNKYQAVFLSNNQIYFGKLSLTTDKSYRLTDIYYIKSQVAGQTAQSGNQTAPSQSSDTPTLVKLGQELHGPEDQIVFNNSQVLFWENLKPDGKVSKAIADFNNKK